MGGLMSSGQIYRHHLQTHCAAGTKCTPKYAKRVRTAMLSLKAVLVAFLNRGLHREGHESCGVKSRS